MVALFKDLNQMALPHYKRAKLLGREGISSVCDIK